MAAKKKSPLRINIFRMRFGVNSIIVHSPVTEKIAKLLLHGRGCVVIAKMTMPVFCHSGLEPWFDSLTTLSKVEGESSVF